MSDPFKEKESKDRVTKFMKAYDALVIQYSVELMAFPQLAPSGQHGFNIAASLFPIDKKNQPIPSPLSEGSAIK